MSFISSLGEWLRKVSKSFMSATISGKTITLTRHNGDTVTLTTQDTTYEEASQSTSGLMSAEDKAILDAIPSTYAVKSGSLTDNPIIRTSQSGREANIINIGSDLTNPDTSETFDLGWNYVNRDGALLGLRSSSYSTEPGYFKLYARDEDNQSILQGTPNGELTWRGNQVITIIDTATATKNGVMTAADKIKLDGITAGAEPNQNAFSNIKVGSTTVAADGKTDTFELVAGSNITLTPDATNDTITIAATDTVYTHPTTAGNKHIPSGGSSGQILRWSANGTAVWGADSNTTYPAFSTAKYVNANGLVDAFSFYDNDAQGNRTATIRVTNGNGYHEMLFGVHNEANGAPVGFWVRNTAGALTSGIAANFQANSFNGYTLDLDTNNNTDTWVPVLNSKTLQHRVIPVTKNRNFTKNNTYVQAANNSIANVISGTYLSLVVYIKNMSSKWTDYKIGTIASGSSIVCYSVLVDQATGIGIPFRVNSNGEVYVTIKNVLPENNGWLWGGIFIPNA